MQNFFYFLFLARIVKEFFDCEVACGRFRDIGAIYALG
jgi:hypothetical protein